MFDSKAIKKKIISTVISYCNDFKISNNNIGMWLRALHIYSFFSNILAISILPLQISFILIFLLALVPIWFYLLDGCLLSEIENILCDDKFNMTDIFLEALNWDINKKNRFIISYYVFGSCSIIVVYLMCRRLKHN